MNTKKTLVEMLSRIRDDDDFIICVLSNTETEENWKRMIRFLETGVTSVDEIFAMSVLLSKNPEVFDNFDFSDFNALETLLQALDLTTIL